MFGFTSRAGRQAARRMEELREAEPVGMAEAPVNPRIVVEPKRVPSLEEMVASHKRALDRYVEKWGSLRDYIMPAEEGRKDDQSKDRFELLPGDALRAIAVILTFGAAKYGDRNWEKGMKWSRVYGATLRHLTAWWEGEKLDAETGKSHLWHAGCCVLFLIAYEIRSVGEDDRPTGDERG